MCFLYYSLGRSNLKGFNVKQRRLVYVGFSEGRFESRCILFSDITNLKKNDVTFLIYTYDS